MWEEGADGLPLLLEPECAASTVRSSEIEVDIPDGRTSPNGLDP
jgi:hypothetical protein